MANNATNEPDDQVIPKKSVAKAKATKKKAPAKKKASRKTKKGAGDHQSIKRERRVRQFPAVSFEQATKLGESICKYAPGETQVRRLTILDKLELAETSRHAQHLITHSGQYGITEGSYKAEWIKLTTVGDIACNPDISKRERLKARFSLAIEGIPPFQSSF